MRKLSYLLTLLVVFACSDDFTTSPAVGALSDAALQNETGVNLLLTGAYSALSAEVNHGYGNGWGRAADNWTMDVMADDAHKGSTDDDQADLKIDRMLDQFMNMVTKMQKLESESVK